MPKKNAELTTLKKKKNIKCDKEQSKENENKENKENKEKYDIEKIIIIQK